MQAALPRYRNALILKNAIAQSKAISASFHSTIPILGKWNSKWKNSDIRDNQRPTKNYVRYTTRQKRADAKKALKDLLLKGIASKGMFEESFSATGSKWVKEQADHVDNKDRSKSSARHANKTKRMRNKSRRGKAFEDSDEYTDVFQATFGNRWYTWSFKSWDEHPFRSSSTGFEWREEPTWNKRRLNESDIESETESDKESCVVGKFSDRMVLGLPARGPLKIDDVKNAFRLAALRWHPDRHQGPSQTKAEEKFKECATAYKSLCDALSAA